MYKKIKFVAAYGLQQRTFLCNKLVNSSTCQLVNSSTCNLFHQFLHSSFQLAVVAVDVVLRSVINLNIGL